MKRPLKILLSVTAGLALLLVISIAIALLLFDPNDYKEELAELAQQKSGQKVTIEGDLSLTLFPWLGIQSGKVTLGNPAGFSERQPLASIAHAAIKIRLLPLLSKRLEVGAVQLSGLKLHLIRQKSGKNNWQPLLDRLKHKPAKSDQPGDQELAGSGLNAFVNGSVILSDAMVEWDDQLNGRRFVVKLLDLVLDTVQLGAGNHNLMLADQATRPGEKKPAKSLLSTVVIGGVALNDAMVEWDDQLKGRKFEVKKLNLALERFQIDRESSLKLVFNLHTLPHKFAAEVRLIADLTVAPSFERFTLNDLKLTTFNQGWKLPESGLEAYLSVSRLMVKPNETLYQAEKIELTAHGRLKNSNFELQFSTPNLTIDDHFQQLAIGPAQLVLDGEKKDGISQQAELAASSIDLKLSQQTLHIADFKLTSGGLTLHGDIQGEQIKTAAQFNSPLTIDPLNPRQLMQEWGVTPPKFSDATALSALSGGCQLEVNRQEIVCRDLKLKLDKSAVSGSLKYLLSAKPAIQFDLAADTIDIARYQLQPSGKGKKSSAKNRVSRAPIRSGSMMIPVASPSTTKKPQPEAEKKRSLLRVNGNITVKQLNAGRVQGEGAKIQVDGEEGIYRLPHSIKKVYQGHYKGVMKLDLNHSEPHFNLKASMKGVQIKPLLKALKSKQILSGNLRVKAELKGRGSNGKAIGSSLKGAVDAWLTDGSYYGINVAQLIRETKAKVEGKPLTGPKPENKTDFSSLTLRTTLADHILHVQKVDLESPLLHIYGSGRSSLENQQMEYRLKAEVTKDFKTHTGIDIKEIEGVPLPLLVTGTPSKPKAKIDAKEAIKAVYNAKFKGKKDKLIEKIEKKIGKGTTNILKKLIDKAL